MYLYVNLWNIFMYHTYMYSRLLLSALHIVLINSFWVSSNEIRFFESTRQMHLLSRHVGWAKEGGNLPVTIGFLNRKIYSRVLPHSKSFSPFYVHLNIFIRIKVIFTMIFLCTLAQYLKNDMHDQNEDEWNYHLMR